MESKKPSCLCHLQDNIPRIHVVFTFLIPLLMNLLQVDYQTKKVSPLVTHPINIWVFFAATYLYCLGLSLKTELQIHQPNYSQFIYNAILSLGALSAISLASIFLPRLLGWFCLGLWTVLPTILARHFLKKRIIEKLTNRFNQFRGAHIEESEQACVRVITEVHNDQEDQIQQTHQRGKQNFKSAPYTGLACISSTSFIHMKPKDEYHSTSFIHMKSEGTTSFTHMKSEPGPNQMKDTCTLSNAIVDSGD